MKFNNTNIDQSGTMSLRGLFGDSMRRGFAGGGGNGSSSSSDMDWFNSTDFANDHFAQSVIWYYYYSLTQYSMNNGSDHNQLTGITNETTPLFTIVDWW